MRYLPKSALRAVGVLTAAAALARTANGQGVVRTPAVIRARWCSVISIYTARISRLSLKNMTGDAQFCPVAWAPYGAPQPVVWRCAENGEWT
jgi:hypothetical protein